MPTQPLSRHDTKRRLLRNTSANAVAQAASMLSSLVFVPLLVHAFGIANYGVMMLGISVSAFAAILDLGMGSALVRTVAERAARGDHEGVARATVTAAILYGVIGVAVAGTMVVLALLGPSVFRLTGNQADLLKNVLIILAVGQLWYWPSSAPRSALGGLQRYDLGAGVALCIVAADIIAMTYTVVTHHGPVVLVALRAAETAVASVLYVAFTVRLLPSSARRLTASRADASTLVRTGSPIFILTVTQLITHQQADRLILGVMLGPAAVGFYEVASKLVTLVSTMSGISASAVLPVATELHANEEEDALRSLFLRGVKIMSTLTAPAIAILIAIAGPFIVAWCGPSLGPAIAVAHVLLLAQIFLPLYELGDPLMIARGRYSAYVTAGLVCAVLNVALSIVFVRFFGMTGVALGTLAALYVEFPWLVRVFSRAMALPVGEWMKRTAWPLYPLLALPALLAYAGGQSVLGHSILGLAVVGAVSIFAYWLAAAFTAYSPVERADLVSIVLPSRRVRAA